MTKQFLMILVLGAMTLFSSCSDDDGEMKDDLVGDDPIPALLTNASLAYEALPENSWISITEAEYERLASELPSVVRSGANETYYSNENLTFPGTQFTFLNDIGATIPAGSYLFAFKYVSQSGVDARMDQVKISENGVNGTFNNIGGGLPGHAAGESFFVLKNNRTATSAEGLLALYSRDAIGYSLGNDVGNYYFTSGDASTMENQGGEAGLVLSFQGLSSTDLYQN